MSEGSPGTGAEGGISISTERTFWSTLFCVACLLACILVSHPVVEAGVDDDWAYIWSAKMLAETGHVVYQGWATAMLGWQLYLGALCIKLFGFSFTAVRASTVVLSLAAAAITHRLFLRLGTGAWNASIATLSIVLSPLFLPLAATFMSDVPGYLAVIVCCYFAVRAVQANSANATIAWLVAAAISNDALGMVRQISWLGALVLVPSAAWCVRRRRGVPLTAGALWVLSLVFIAACMRWFNRQPYALHENLFFSYHRNQLMQIYDLSLAALFLVLPVLSAYAVSWGSRRRAFGYGALLAGAVCGCGLVLLDHSRGFFAVDSVIMPFMNIVPLGVRLAVVGFAFACAFCFAAQLWRAASDLGAFPPFVSERPDVLPGRTLLLLFGPFTWVYMLFVCSRTSLWPRYLLPVLPIFMLLLLWVYPRDTARRRLPALCAAAVVVSALIAIANTHDIFANISARLVAANRVLAAGVPRTAIEAGFELDGWAQLEITGYVNDRRLLYPPGAYRPPSPSTLPAGCHNYFLDWTPSIQPRFKLSDIPSICFPPASFPPVRYWTWCPPHDRAIYTSAVAEERDMGKQTRGTPESANRPVAPEIGRAAMP